MYLVTRRDLLKKVYNVNTEATLRVHVLYVT